MCNEDSTKDEKDTGTTANMEERKKSLLKKIFENVSLEPMLFVKMLAEGNLKVVADTLEIERVCLVNLGYPPENCSAMDDGNHTQVQTEVQRYQNVFNYYQSLLDSLLPLLVVLFVGSMSDRYGRKLPMLVVLFGFILNGTSYLLMAVFPKLPVEFLLIGTFAVDITGSWVVFNMAVYSYISDITTTVSRTKRMGITDAMWYAGSPLGTMMGGWLFRSFGYVAVYATSTVLWIGTFVYTLVAVKESRRPNNDDKPNSGKFCIGHAAALFSTLFKKRQNRGRGHLISIIGLKLGVFMVQGHIMYQWARRVLGWNPTQYSTWAAVDEASHQLGMVVWVWVAEMLGLHNCIIAIGGLLSIMMWSVTLATIISPLLWWLVIVATISGLLEASIEPALRSMMTAIVGLGEEGKILGAMGMLEAGWFAIDRAIYTALYNSFIESFPQINFVVQATISLVLIFLVIILYGNMKRCIAQKYDADRGHVD